MKKLEREYLQKHYAESWKVLKECEARYGRGSREAEIARVECFVYKRICDEFGIECTCK